MIHMRSWIAIVQEKIRPFAPGPTDSDILGHGGLAGESGVGRPSLESPQKLSALCAERVP